MNPFIKALTFRANNANDIILIDAASGNEFSAKDILELSYEFAGKLWASGIRQDDHIIISISASPNYYALLYGSFLIGAIPSLVDVNQNKAKLIECVDELKPSLWISDNEISDFVTVTVNTLLGLEPAKFSKSLVTDSTVCLLLYTSGTTGTPKGVPWTVGQLISQAQELNNFHQVIDTEFVIFPYLALASIYNKRKAVIPNTSSLQPNRMPIGNILKQMEKFGCDYIFASPAFWVRVIEHLNRTSSKLDFITIISTAGSSLSLNMLSELNALLQNGEIYIPYASTEALLPITQINFTQFQRLSMRQTARAMGVPLGKACDGIELSIIPPTSESSKVMPLTANLIGEIVVSGKRITSEYFRRPDLTKASKVTLHGSPIIWHKMGDLGYIDDNGMVWFMTRKKYAVPIGDEYFFPDAIEHYINLHTGIHSSAVIYHQGDHRITVVIPEFECKDLDFQLIENKVQELGYKSSTTMLYPTLLPTDKRHNSKVDRDTLKIWVESNHEALELEAER
ncbi:AMP-binding protein [Vibrio tapetis]|uniref:Putative Peptide synthase n=1 Tax=Vibrio tapetis subsp. tapetis TaxID=1671868 RepID=A0A2N8ZD51_9VIBR|nr:AMP-binding protein [Vibrio tapetis]SON49823.1 putative Peptide synthase [Vibrio tapetis subsp. tapetis]